MAISRNHGSASFACDGTLQAVQADPLEAESHEQRQHPDDMHKQHQ